MTVTLNELLTLVGRLDDSTSFDTPRERFRRFLLEHVTNARLARELIEQCQHAPGEQHLRALQDIVVVLGRSLGFETKFGNYLPAAGARRADGQWHARRVDVVLEIRTDRAQPTSLDGLARSIAALTGTSHRGTAGRVLGLCVLTPLYVTRAFPEDAQRLETGDPRLRIVTLRSLLSLAGMVGDGRLTHDELVRLLGSDLELDFVVELLERAAGAARTDGSSPARPDVFEIENTGYWLATIAADQGATPEQFVEVVIGKRHILGVSDNGSARGTPHEGDRICFYVPGKGIVGRGLVRSTAASGNAIRDAHRFNRLLELEDTVVHVDAPVPLEEELQLRLRAARANGGGTAHTLMRITRQEFEAVSTNGGPHVQKRRTGDVAPAAPGETESLPLSVGGSRSPE